MKTVSRLAVGAALAALLLGAGVPVAFSKEPKPLPPEVQSEIDEAIKSCDEKVKFAKGFMTRRDINGDGIEDFILDYGHFHCGERSADYCGSAGCLTQAFASLPDGKFAKVLDQNAHSVRFTTLRGRPAMLLRQHGSACGRRIGAELCNVTLYWNGKKFN